MTLPIFSYNSNIVNLVRENQVTIIYGDPGLGKTTQIPRYLLESGLNQQLLIGVTQPYRLSAIFKAKRATELSEVSCKDLIGYEVVGDDKSGPGTKIKYMDEDTLLNIFIKDGSLTQYRIIIIDEAHERTTRTDILLGMLKSLLRTRADLKVVISASNIPREQFSSFFNNAPILKLQSYTNQVLPIYEPIKDNDYVSRVVNIVYKTLNNFHQGDYLIFLPTEKEVEICCKQISNISRICVIQIYESMNSPPDLFKTPSNKKLKVFVTTRIGETMFTIPSVRYVIDCGLVTEIDYDSEFDINVCKEKPISKARAELRKSKAGCKNKGWIYRIFRKETFTTFLDDTIPEIKRKDFSEMYWTLIKLGKNPATFDYLDRPNDSMLTKCESQCHNFHLLDSSNSLTTKGKNVADIPMDLFSSLMLLSDSSSRDMITIVAAMSEKSIFTQDLTTDNYNVKKSQETLCSQDGDQFTALNFYNEFVKNDKSKEWCDYNLINYDALERIDRLRNELIGIIEGKCTSFSLQSSNYDTEKIKSAFIKVYYKNICVRNYHGRYIGFINRKIYRMDPNSCMCKEAPKLILFQESCQDAFNPIIYGILKLDETLLKKFPKKMAKIKYTTETIIGDESISFRYDYEEPYYDPFGKNEHGYYYKHNRDSDYDDDVYSSYDSDDYYNSD